MKEKTKKCIKCLQEKPVSEFYLKNKNSTITHSYCKKCSYEILKLWRKNNKNKFKEYKKKYQESIKGKKSNKKYYETHKEKIKLYYSQPNVKEKNKELKKQPHRRKKILEYEKNKYYNDIQFNIAKKIRTRLYKSIHVKSDNMISLVGCDMRKLKYHLTSLFISGMTWELVLSGDIHIDHIIPVSSFDLTDIEQQKKCFHYTNLQPLWAEENWLKGKKIKTT